MKEGQQPQPTDKCNCGYEYQRHPLPLCDRFTPVVAVEDTGKRVCECGKTAEKHFGWPNAMSLFCLANDPRKMFKLAFRPLTDEQYNSPANQNRDNPIIGTRAAEDKAPAHTAGTKEWAIEQMKQGRRVKHRYFSPREWITMNGVHIVGEDRGAMPCGEFWAIRESVPEWLIDWTLADEEYAVLSQRLEEAEKTLQKKYQELLSLRIELTTANVKVEEATKLIADIKVDCLASAMGNELSLDILRRIDDATKYQSEKL